MQAEHFYLTSLEVVKRVSARLLDFELDGKVKVTFSDAGTKSSKQRGIDWAWNTEIAAHYKTTGTGGAHYDTKEGIHLICKWRFGSRILQRDDTFFAGLWDRWQKDHKSDKRAIMWFVENHISTEQFTHSQMGEYLTEKKIYYLNAGVNLTEPEFRGLLDYDGT
ncbi:hypothetical protein KAR91_48325 [Candidatus Pacearchaeota archaeon]|nr:hypothetical protein [Candidatus Pacearchaeota archaeon]